MLLMITKNARDICIRNYGKDITQEICNEIYAGRYTESTIENAQGKAQVRIVEVEGQKISALIADSKLITIYTSNTIYGHQVKKKKFKPKTVYVRGEKKEINSRNKWVDLSDR